MEICSVGRSSKHFTNVFYLLPSFTFDKTRYNPWYVYCFTDEIKPDMVWPFTSKITATAVSEDTSLMIIGLTDGNIVMWDRYLGNYLVVMWDRYLDNFIFVFFPSCMLVLD